MPAQQKNRKRQFGKDLAGKEIKRLWGDAPVTDATADLRVFIKPEDVEGAVRQDPSCCVFARACKRLFGSTKVLFFRSVAYVELHTESGDVRVERFMMPETMRHLVETFDRGEGVIPQGGFLLKKPRKSETLDSASTKRKVRKMRAAAGSKSSILGERVGGESPQWSTSKPIFADLTVRNGSGAVHFPPTSKKGKEKK